MGCSLLLLTVPLLAAAQSVTVEGVAFNRLTKVGAPHAEVTLKAGDEVSYVTSTTATGRFRLGDVPAGEYDVVMKATGFVRYEARRIRLDGSGARVEAPLAPLGSIAGKVWYPHGREVKRVLVEVFGPEPGAGASVFAERNGAFVVKDLAPGRYRLRARPLPHDEDAPPLVSGNFDWTPTFFPNAIDLSGAEPIPVREGDALKGFDILLRSVPVYRLRGVVRDEAGNPVANASLRLLSEIGWGMDEARATSAADGAFEFPTTRAADWRILSEGFRGPVRLQGLTVIAMSDHDEESAVARIAPAFHLDGRVDGAPAGQAGPIVELLGADGRRVAFQEPGGRLAFKEVYPGRYRVGLLNSVAGHYVKAVYLGEEEITGREVELTPSSPPLRVVMTPNAARVTGTVENGGSARVVMSHDDGTETRVARCDDAGRFVFEGVRPGGWRVEAGLEPAVESVRLREGEVVNLRLRIP